MPAVLTQPEHLAFLATMLTWKGGPPPAVPPSLGMTLPELIALLEVKANRDYVVRRLSFFVRGGGNA